MKEIRMENLQKNFDNLIDEMLKTQEPIHVVMPDGNGVVVLPAELYDNMQDAENWADDEEDIPGWDNDIGSTDEDSVYF